MERLHKEPDTYRRDYNAFVNELKQFHHNRGTQFRHVPRINGREIDLFSLYNQVTAQGGWQKVNDSQKWDVIFDNLKLPKGCVNASLALRQLYIRYLGLYEKIHFLGEDPDDEHGQSPEGRSRKHHTSLFQLVPMSYNYAQHEVSDVSRTASGLCQNIIRPTDYDKICLSLLSGLPNEQEFALNICTILSNEGNHVLHLEQLPRLVDLLLGLAGIWRKDDPSLKTVFSECWKEIQGRDIETFWQNTLDNKKSDVVELFGHGKKMVIQDDSQLFHLEKEELGAHNVLGQRILKVALILHNLSYEKHNIPVLASNSNFLRFLSYCIHCNWSYLQRVALDTLGNLASHVKLSLEEDLCSRIIFKTVVEGIKSQDRFIVIRCMEILSQLCRLESNEEIITSRLDSEVYQQMVKLLTIPDIMLLIYVLEALYALSEFGTHTCEKIVRTYHSIGALVSLLTLEPGSYGQAAQAGMKLVETFEPVPVTETLPPTTSKTYSANSSSQSSGDVDSETFACNWLRATYELCHGYSISRNDIYADYVTHCSKAGRKAVINANSFANCVRTVFPHCGLKRTESSTGIITFHHDGLRRRINHSNFQSKGISSDSSKSPLKTSFGSNLGPPSRSLSVSPNPTHSPILKAQLSAPPRPLPSVSQVHPQLQQALARQPSVSPSPPPSPRHPSPSTTPTPSQSNSAGSSTLIKSLLASKVTRNLQRQQLLQQQSTPVNQPKPSSPTNTVLSSMGIPIISNQHGKLPPKSPQRGIVTLNKEQTVSSPSFSSKQNSSPNIGKNLPKIQKSPFRTGTIISTSRLNGLQREIQLEVCSIADDAKGANDNLQDTQGNQVQNHILDKNISTTGESGIRTGCPQETETNIEEEKIETLQGAKCMDVKESTTSCSTSLPAPLVSVTSPKQNNPNNLNNQSFLKSKSQTSGINSTFLQNSKSQNGSGVFAESSASQKLSTSHLLKSVLSNMCEITEDEELSKKRQLDKVYKSSPLLNGLLDKGKIALVMEKEQTPNVQNGNTSTSKQDDGVKEPKLFESDSNSSSNYSIEVRNAIGINHTNGEGISVDKGNVQSTEQGTTESPENSNLVSDLSSISDIARTLESASKAISQTNIECHANVPFPSTSVTTPSTTQTIRTSPQITVVQPNSQVRLPSTTSNITLRFLYTIPRRDDSNELIGFPRVSLNQLNQLRQQTESNSTAMKRPSSDSTSNAVEAKRIRPENKMAVLETNVHCPLSAIPPVIITTTKSPNNVNQDTKSFQTTSKQQKIEQSRPPSVNSTDSESSKESQILTQASTSTDSSSSTNTSSIPLKVPSKLEYICEWKGCNRSFTTPTSVFFHASKTHLPVGNEESECKWENCDSMKRKRLSLLTHLQDWHCSDQVLQVQALRRQQIAQHGKSALAPPQPPPPHPGYAPDAALLAIRRHALQLVSTPEIKLEEKEDSLTKSIRLTSALILRNLVESCALARSYLKRYESDLMVLATASLESSRTIAHCLSELARPHE
ncbi:AT-rich interactive domain-containing protein 2 isoform X1 [Centruroides vittatus]|uniref:AT-rich interactive domain-containing protein 2 isoform X1 n=1 Tax=Centruroides vittatus TaxID=120091 RepID=UPI00350EDCD2